MHPLTTHSFASDMESLRILVKLFSSLIFYLSVSSLLVSPPMKANPPIGTTDRTTKQQILASIPPNTEDNSMHFLTSPSGKYSAYLRHVKAPGAGGFGNDFCYIQVQDTSTDQSVWESECAPVSEDNECALVFDDASLEVFDGSNPVWDTGAQSADNNPLETLEHVDEGDMRVRDRTGEPAWKASDDPRANQACGLPGSPGLAPAMPPFAKPIGGAGNFPFGQQQPQPTVHNQQEQPVSGAGQGFGLDAQPLVDNTPCDSGSARGTGSWLRMSCVLLLIFLVNIFCI